ncbi:MAG TPA: ADP-ribose pyrophosphatase [Lachnospiraceae bacterium]|nr:ADP-ribose pyrophosphatase [Lachnospiraceae bacterium]
MKYKKMDKVHEGKFITSYDITYETMDGQTKVYEMISRDNNATTLADLNNPKVDSVVLMLTNETEDKILLSREFRLAMGAWVYNFPAGLIDPGETPEESARRELWEETGLELVSIDDVLFESYAAIGFSNEKNVCIVGKARGEFRKSTSSFEEIEPGWFTAQELSELLKTEHFAARTQAYCYMWAKYKLLYTGN